MAYYQGSYAMHEDEAWINWNNFLVELQYDDVVDDSDSDLLKYLQSTIISVNEYLNLVPQNDLAQAEQVKLSTKK